MRTYLLRYLVIRAPWGSARRENIGKLFYFNLPPDNGFTLFTPIKGRIESYQKNAKNQYALLPGISVTVLASHFSSVIGNFRSSGRLDLHVWYLKTLSRRKLSHNGCTAGNFDLPDHGFLLLTWSTGPMEWSTGNSYQAAALTNVLRVRRRLK
jgi:hypothetical protein